MSEALIDRVLCAVRFIDATTGAHVTSPLKLKADKPMTWRRNASGAYVLWRALGLDAHTGDADGLDDTGFEALFKEPPGTPAAGSLSFVVTVEEPSGEYLPRSFELRLPRAKPGLFEPVKVSLYRSTAARPEGIGARLYATVRDDGSPSRRVPGARVKVIVNSVEVGRGVTGANGEAVIELTRLATFTTSGGGGAVTTDRFSAEVRADVLLAVSDGAWAFEAAPDFDGARFEGPAARVNVAAGKLEPGSIAGTEPVTLTAGSIERVTITVSPPR